MVELLVYLSIVREAEKNGAVIDDEEQFWNKNGCIHLNQSVKMFI